MKTCSVQFCVQNNKGDWVPNHKKDYLYNFPDEYAAVGSIYHIETNIPYKSPVYIMKVCTDKYDYTANDLPIKDVQKITKVIFNMKNPSNCDPWDKNSYKDSKLREYLDNSWSPSPIVLVKEAEKGRIDVPISVGTYTIKADKKENVNMKNMFGMNFEFGKVPAGKFKMSFMGLAFDVGNGRYAVYDAGENEFTDVTEMTMDADGMIMQMPVSINDLELGDIIKHKDAYVVIRDVNDSGSILAVDPFRGEEINIVPTKSIFGFNFVTKVMNIFGDMFKTSEIQPSAENPFGNIMPFIMMSAMSKDKSDNDSMMKMLMFSQMVNKEAGVMDFTKNPMSAMMLMNMMDN